jgi:hypothetical protein
MWQSFPKSKKICQKNASLFLIVMLVLLYFYQVANAQAAYVFEANAKFNLENGCTISFSVNGTYEQAILKDDEWQYRNLQLNGSQKLENLQVSTKNSNITITSYRQTNTTMGSARLRYLAEGQGVQTFNFGPMQRLGQWSVVANGIYLSEDKDWTVTEDDKLTITGATGDISLTYYYHPPSYEESLTQPIYQSHSVIIVVVVALCIMMIFAILINTKRERADPMRLKM